jgi:hypothetical protein
MLSFQHLVLAEAEESLMRNGRQVIIKNSQVSFLVIKRPMLLLPHFYENLLEDALLISVTLIKVCHLFFNRNIFHEIFDSLSDKITLLDLLLYYTVKLIYIYLQNLYIIYLDLKVLEDVNKP